MLLQDAMVLLVLESVSILCFLVLIQIRNCTPMTLALLKTSCKGGNRPQIESSDYINQINQLISEEILAQNRSRRNATDGDKYVWNSTNIFWSFDEDTLNLTKLQKNADNVRKVFRDAFSEWSLDTCLTFSEVEKPDNADIIIKFAREFGKGEKFDGEGNVFGHTYFPGSGLGGDMFFDPDENWLLYPYSEEGDLSLKLAAIHEIGHALGLEHSNDSYSLVHPYVYVDSVLKEGDIQHIRDLYHCKLETAFTTRTTLRPPPNPYDNDTWTTESSNTDQDSDINGNEINT